VKIYEACNFQDITGQRINKVVRTISFIEERVTAMLALTTDPANSDRRSVAPPKASERRSRYEGIRWWRTPLILSEAHRA
jgi:chemotaxis regulatin CheY-phosphate phosphatase CheZ